MAIDQIPYQEADHFTRTQKTFYPVHIPVSHWQLRHYISNPEPDLLYYASGHDIYCLNTASKKRRHIATLPFEARCSASAYGWICVGGEDEGHFAAIKLDGPNAAGSTLGVDDALPIDGRRLGSNSVGSGARRAASVKVERIGEEIVNSISIHRIQDESAHLDDIVAVLTNNDRTVRVYSLPQALETTVLNLPFPINHATVSPDGQMLVAVGDFNEAHFFSREIKGEVPQIPKPHNRLTSQNLEWVSSNVVNLHASSPELTSGYFTTAWSPSGRLCAVGSEGGYITVFDVQMLADPDLFNEDAIVVVVPSTRPDLPQPHPGAVRTLMFSPDPWDLLIWAEDQGRICIGDLRNGLESRQIITLEPKEGNFEKIEYDVIPTEEDTTALETRIEIGSESLHGMEADFIRRHGNISESAATSNYSTDDFAARRRSRQVRQEMANAEAQGNGSRAFISSLDDDVQGLNSHEQQVLNALRTTRQRLEARSPGQIPRSVNYTTAELFNHGATSSSARSPTASTTNTAASSSTPLNDILSSVRDELPQLARTSAAAPRPESDNRESSTLPPLRAFAAELPNTSSSISVRVADGSRLPRRRASIILTPPTSNPSPTSSAAADISTPQGASAAPRSPTAAITLDEENPWRTIEDAMHLARGPLFESASRAPGTIHPLPGFTSNANITVSASGRPTESELEAELAAERARARALARQRERYRAQTQQQATSNTTNNPANGTNPTRPREQPRRRYVPDGLQEGYDVLLRRQHRPGNGFASRFSGEVGTRTAGLAMSQDGRRLWAACEDGIFEVEVNLKGRMFFPGVDLK